MQAYPSVLLRSFRPYHFPHSFSKQAKLLARKKLNCFRKKTVDIDLAYPQTHREKA